MGKIKMNIQYEKKNITMVPNSLLEVLSKVNFSAYENRILMLIIRKTMGFHKEWDRISYTQLEKGTNIKRRHIGRAINKSEAKNIIRKNKKGGINEYTVNLLTGTWIVNDITCLGNSTRRGNNLLPKMVKESLPKKVNTKEKKYRLNKEDLIKSIGTNL